MTGGAVVIEVVLLVIRVGCRGEVAGVAIEASARRICVSGSMAGNASQGRMRTGQAEASRAVVKVGGLPCRSGMTARAIVIEVVLLVIRLGCRGEVAGVAVETSARRIRVPGGMTGNASQRRVRTGQAEASCTVVKACGFPCRSGMTARAIVIEVVLLVIRFGRRSEVTGVAVETSVRRACVSGSVTGYAGRRGVRSG